MQELLGGGRREIRERIDAHSGQFYEVDETALRGRTRYQEIEVLRSPSFGRVLLLDGATQVMETNEFQYHEPLVHPALLAHPRPERVLLIGGGDGCSLREALKHPCIERVDFVELDEEVVEFSRREFSDLNRRAFDDPRVTCYFMDGRTFVEGARPVYDAVIMDMTDPSGSSLPLYTLEFFRAAKRLLRDRQGLFAMHTESPETRPGAFSLIRRTLARAFPCVRGVYAYVRMYGTLWSFAIGSEGPGPAELDAGIAAERIEARGLAPLRLVSSASLPGLLASTPSIDALLRADGGICADASPEFPDSFDYRA